MVYCGRRLYLNLPDSFEIPGRQEPGGADILQKMHLFRRDRNKKLAAAIAPDDAPMNAAFTKPGVHAGIVYTAMRFNARCRIGLYSVVRSLAMKTLSILTIFILFTAALSFAEVREPKTGVSFQETKDAGGKTLSLSGVGLRSKMMFKVYAGALYLDPSVKNDLASFKGQAGNPTQALYDAICKGPFTKMFVLHFVRDVDHGKITESFEEGLEKSIKTDGPDAADVKAFLQASGADMKEGQEMSVLINGDEITVTTPTATAKAIKNANLANAIAAIWLGKDPISDDLKKGMVSRLPSLL